MPANIALAAAFSDMGIRLIDLQSAREAREIFPDLSHNDRGILAIDPSIRACGWAVVRGNSVSHTRVNSGTWHPSQAQDATDRWQQLADFVRGMISGDTIAYAVIEAPNRRKIAREEKFSRASQISYGRAMGIVEGVCRSEFEFSEKHVYTPDVEAWKRRQSKRQTLNAVALRLRYTPRDSNEADALGLALWFMDQCRCKL